MKTARRGFSVALIAVALVLSVTAMAAEQAPAPGARDKCPVCGMFVARHPDWMALFQRRQGPPLFCCGPKDLFKFIHAPDKYLPEVSRQDVAAILVKDYYSLAFIDARGAHYVVGSDVQGPMGQELIPFVSREGAAEFMRDHSGERMLTYAEITPQILRGLD
jgi:nitrous oxide reductase accessory protein NosL